MISWVAHIGFPASRSPNRCQHLVRSLFPIDGLVLWHLGENLTRFEVQSYLFTPPGEKEGGEDEDEDDEDDGEDDAGDDPDPLLEDPAALGVDDQLRDLKLE